MLEDIQKIEKNSKIVLKCVKKYKKIEKKSKLVLKYLKASKKIENPLNSAKMWESIQKN